jgi:hypothetical protein
MKSLDQPCANSTVSLPDLPAPAFEPGIRQSVPPEREWFSRKQVWKCPRRRASSRHLNFREYWVPAFAGNSSEFVATDPASSDLALVSQYGHPPLWNGMGPRVSLRSPGDDVWGLSFVRDQLSRKKYRNPRASGDLVNTSSAVNQTPVCTGVSSEFAAVPPTSSHPRSLFGNICLGIL